MTDSVNKLWNVKSQEDEMDWQIAYDKDKLVVIVSVVKNRNESKTKKY